MINTGDWTDSFIGQINHISNIYTNETAKLMYYNGDWRKRRGRVVAL